MSKLIETITGGYSSSAKVVSDTLVLSLPDAKAPVVWRMDLKNIKAAALEIETTDAGDFMLVMKDASGKKQDIAPFEHKARALKALMAASHAMEHAHGEKEAANNGAAAGTAAAPAAAPAKSKGGQMLAGLIGIAVLGVLLFMLVRAGPQGQSFSAGNTGAAAPAASMTDGSGRASGQPGVPMSADDFLMRR